MKRRLVLNTGSNYLVFVLQIIVAFIMTPLYVRYMGLTDYGLWEVVVSVIGYAGMLDLGLWPTISRFVAKYQAEGDREKQEATFATSLLFLGAVSVVGSLLTLGVVVSLERDLFFGDGPDVGYYRLFLLILAFSVVLKLPGIVAEAYLEGQQRYFLKNMISIANLAFSTCIVYALIDEVRGLLLLSTVGVISMSLKYGIFFTMLFRSQPQEFTFRLSAFSGRHLRVLLRFGLKSFVQGLSGRVANQSGPLIIAAVGSTAMVPLYTIPASLIRYATTFLMTSTHAFMPLFSELAASGQNDRIKGLYLVANKAVAAIGSLMLVGVVLVGPDFLAIWISQEVAADSGPILAYLAIGALGLGFNPFGSRYLTAIDKHGVYARYSPIFAAIGVLLAFSLMLWVGLPGLAMGFAAPVLISLPVFVSAVCRNLKLSIFAYFVSFIPATIIASSSAVAGWWLLRSNRGQPTDYLDIALTVIVMGSCFAGSFALVDLASGRRSVSVLRTFFRGSFKTPSTSRPRST